MRITITARHTEIPENFVELLETKLKKLERFGHKLMGVHAILGREKYYYTTELTLSAKGFTLVGKAEDARDLVTCMEEALMRLKTQLTRHEAKRMGKLRRLAQRVKQLPS